MQNLPCPKITFAPADRSLERYILTSCRPTETSAGTNRPMRTGIKSNPKDLKARQTAGSTLTILIFSICPFSLVMSFGRNAIVDVLLLGHLVGFLYQGTGKGTEERLWCPSHDCHHHLLPLLLLVYCSTILVYL